MDDSAFDPKSHSMFSHPDLYVEEAKSGNPIFFSGDMQGEIGSFYFNLEKNIFFSGVKFGNLDCKIVGNIVQNTKDVTCYPIWGITPKSGTSDWVDMTKDISKTHDITKNEINFEGFQLKKLI